MTPPRQLITERNAALAAQRERDEEARLEALRRGHPIGERLAARAAVQQAEGLTALQVVLGDSHEERWNESGQRMTDLMGKGDLTYHPVEREPS